MSDTPRTDAVFDDHEYKPDYNLAMAMTKLARGLERECEERRMQVVACEYAMQTLRANCGLDNTKTDLMEVSLLVDKLKQDLDSCRKLAILLGAIEESRNAWKDCAILLFKSGTNSFNSGPIYEDWKRAVTMFEKICGGSKEGD